MGGSVSFFHLFDLLFPQLLPLPVHLDPGLVWSPTLQENNAFEEKKYLLKSEHLYGAPKEVIKYKASSIH